MSPLALVGEEVVVLGQSVLHDLGNSMIPGMSRCSILQLRQAKNGQNCLHLPHFYTVRREFAKPLGDFPKLDDHELTRGFHILRLLSGARRR